MTIQPACVYSWAKMRTNLLLLLLPLNRYTVELYKYNEVLFNKEKRKTRR